MDYGRTKSMFGVSSRDFVTLSHWRVLDDGRICAFATHSEHPSCGDIKGTPTRVRRRKPCEVHVFEKLQN